jgi:tetratricopeptide (TPR) repeat protein
MPITTAIWHFGRGMAQASHGDLDQARSESEKLAAMIKAMPEDLGYGMLNKAHPVLGIAAHTLDAKIATKEKKFADAENHLREAVKLEDDLTYMEPPDWLMPTRESLGLVLLQAGKAADAEKVFREDLDHQPRNGRSLFGLWQSLKTQGKNYDAESVERQFKTAWKNADTKLSIQDF